LHPAALRTNTDLTLFAATRPKWAGKIEKVHFACLLIFSAQRFELTLCVGGKAKPLKAAKKSEKDYDEDDKAFLEKKRAGRPTTGLDTAFGTC
jgi:hypothetical protein